MPQQVVISRIQHRRGRKENLPQPLLPGELALAADEGELWIGGDPQYAPWGVRVFDTSNIGTANGIVNNNIADIEFDGTFTQADFNGLVSYLTGAPTPSVVLEEADILWDGLTHVFVLANDGVSVVNTIANVILAIQDVSNPLAGKYVSGAALGVRNAPDDPFDPIEGVFLLGQLPGEANGQQGANAALLINRYHTAGIATTISNIRVPTAGATVGQLVFRDVTVNDTDAGFTWAADGTLSAESTIDNLTFVSGTGINIDIDPTSKALRITNTSIAASLNLFTDVVVTDTDVGFTWSEDGTISAVGNADTLTFVSGAGIDIDVDPVSKAIIINSLSAGASFSTMTDGTNSAVAVGDDTFTFRTANNRLSLLVTNDEAIHGDNVLFTLEEANIDHNALANYVANEHLDWTVDVPAVFVSELNIPMAAILTYVQGAVPNEMIDHSAVTITGVDSIDGGGDITTDRTLSLLNDVAAPGNDFYYGTDGAGTKGWNALPTVFETVALAADVANQSFTDSFNYTGTPPAPWYDVTAGLEAFSGVLYPDPNISSSPEYYAYIDIPAYDISNTKVVVNINGISAHTGPGFKYIYIEIAGSNLFEAGAGIEIRRAAGDVYTYQSSYYADPGVFVDATGAYVGPTNDIELEIEILANILTFSINGTPVQTADISAYIAQWTAPFVYLVFNEPEVGTTVGVTNFEVSEIVPGAFTWAPTGSTSALTTADTITFVEGENILLDVDAAAQAVRITASKDTDSVYVSFTPTETEFLLVPTVGTIAAQTELNFNGVGDNGVFTAGTGYAALDTITLSDGSVITVDAISTNVSTIAAQTQVNFDGVGSNGTFVAGTDYAALDTITLSDGSVITVDAVSTDVSTIAAQTEINFDGTAGNGTFTVGADYAALDTITLSDGSVITVDAISTDVSTIAAQTEINFDGVGSNGTFVAGTGYVALDTVTLSDGSVITVDAVSTDVSTIAAQTELNFDGVGSNGTFVIGVGYAALDTVTLSDGSVITVDAISTDVSTIASQTQANFDGVGSNGTFAIGIGYAALDTITLSDGSVITVDTISADVSTIAAQTEANFDGVGSNGTFVGGDGAGGTAYVAADTITLSDGTVITVNTVDANDDVATFTITSASTSGFTTGATLTQASTSGTGTGFTLTTGTNNEAAFGDIATFTITTASTSGFTTGATLTQSSTTGTGSGFTLTTGTNNEAAFGDITEFTITTASVTPYTAGGTLTQSSTSGTGSGFTLTTASNNEDPVGDITEFTITTASVTPYTAGSTLTQSSTTGTGTGFTLTTASNNEDPVGDVTAFTVTTASVTPYTAGSTLTQSSTTGTGTGFTLTTASNNEDPVGDVTQFTITTASVTPYTAGSTLTQSSTTGVGTGYTLTTASNNEDPVGDVTEFTVTSASTVAYASGSTLTQSSTTGTGTGYTLTPAANNEAASSTTPLPITGFVFDIDAVSDVIFVEYSLNSGGAAAAANNFTAIGSMKVVANANAETGLANLIDEQTDVRDVAYVGDVEFTAAFVSGSPNQVQIQYTNTLDSDVTMRIVIRRWMSY